MTGNSGSFAERSRKGWRTDIEGLRGIAVLLVVLYHVGFPGFTGGYIGVDVFFVLSGYLITGILVREAEKTGSIDLLNFYARRAKRLLPAAAFLLLFVMAFTFLFYSPLEQMETLRTGLSTTLYYSNFYFGQSATDYLAAGAETNPLLHTWSLSVEEQFYIFWPTMVLLLLFGSVIFRRQNEDSTTPINRNRLIWGTAAVAVLSFAFTLYLNENRQAHWAFFLSPSRFWEFALGGIAVLVPLSVDKLKWNRYFQKIAGWFPPSQNLWGWIGLLAVVGSGMFFSAYTEFPGWAAWIPVLGTVFILRSGSAGREDSLTAFLSWKPLREMGRLSYSWYLWHWPVLVFATAVVGDMSLIAKCLLMILALGMAEVSYRLVENPIRYSPSLRHKPANGMILMGVVTAFSLFLLAAWWSVTERQLEDPLQNRYEIARSDLADIYERKCHSGFENVLPPNCIDGSDDAPFTAVLFGDSHAAQWAPALQNYAEERNWRVHYLTKSSCPYPTVSRFHTQLGRDYSECDSWRGYAMEIIRDVNPDLVIMTSSYKSGVTDQEWLSGTEKTLGDLGGSVGSVVFLQDSPRSSEDIPLCLSRSAWHQKLGISDMFGNCDFDPDALQEKEIVKVPQELAGRYGNVHHLDLTDVICPGGICEAEKNGMITYRDNHHISATYVDYLSDAVYDGLDSLGVLDNVKNLPKAEVVR